MGLGVRGSRLAKPVPSPQSPFSLITYAYLLRWLRKAPIFSLWETTSWSEVEKEPMTSAASLRAIKVLHTIVWAFFAGCIIAIPIFGFSGRYRQAVGLIGVVLIEVLILVANRMRCPLTGIAARYTNDRSANFDIYLPVWVARHNKLIFGLLFLGGTLLTGARWMGWLG